jgi:predicted metalloprotease with PDZ domain
MRLRTIIGAFAATACTAGVMMMMPSIPAGTPPFLSWTVSMKDAHLALVEVECAVTGDLSRRFPFSPPVTGTGKPLEPIGLEAFDRAGHPLGIRRTLEGWEIESGGSDFTMRYDVVLTIEDRYSPEVRGMISRVAGDRSRLMGRDLFLLPGRPVAAGMCVDHRLYAGGATASSALTSGGRVIVPDREDLPASFVVSGDYRVLTATARGVELVLAVGGRWRFGDDELLRVIGDVSDAGIGIFGSSPFDRHLFVCDPNPVRGGKGFDYYGVHFGSTVLLLFDPAMDRSALLDDPMAIVAHEFIHAWNGETLRPRDDSSMWFTEGATVWCSYLVLQKAGVITSGQYEAIRARIGERLGRNRYLGTVPLCRAGNGDLADKEMVGLLYDGGFVAAEALDKRIASASGGTRGLADLLRRLYEAHPGGAEIGEREIAEAASAVAGCDLSEFIAGLIRDPGGLAGEADAAS